MRRRLASWLAGLAVTGALGSGIALAVSHAQRLPTGPVEIVWDREACGHCRMHVGDPAFAAELQTRDGQVVAFDDPGCLLRYVAERQPEVHAIYLHDVRGSGWIPIEAAGFVEVSPTPMGFGLGAVAADTPGALSLDAARARVLSADRGGSHAGD